MFKDKKVTIAITGGIAAYKACEIVSWLRQENAQVQVAMTTCAENFITPMTLKTLSNNVVARSNMNEVDGWSPNHINISECDLFVVVPATANIIAKAANGISDDLISSAIVATKSKVIFAPAMHHDMYSHFATKNNIEKLKSYGYEFIEPGEGFLACGAVGKGRLADISNIKQTIKDCLLKRNDFSGKRILVTAGPTREKIDPVRYISNFSSGKMGYALAEEAKERSAEVILVSGPTSLPNPQGLSVIKVESTSEMYEEVLKHYDDIDIVIKAAAVADYKASEVSYNKIKKLDNLKIDLVKNIDILALLGERKNKQILIGFAAETENIYQYAKNKIKEKNLDMIILNDISKEGAGFDVDTNIISIINASGQIIDYPLISKKQAATEILNNIKKLPGF